MSLNFLLKLLLTTHQSQKVRELLSLLFDLLESGNLEPLKEFRDFLFSFNCLLLAPLSLSASNPLPTMQLHHISDSLTRPLTYF